MTDDAKLTPELAVEILKGAGDFLRFNRHPKQTLHILQRFTNDGDLVIDTDRLNHLLLSWHLRTVKKHFVDHYFGGPICETKQLRSGLESFMKDALWHLGSVNRGFDVLSQQSDIPSFLKEFEHDTEEMLRRLPLPLIQEIAPSDRGFLGYVSGERPFREQECTDTAEAVLNVLEKYRSDFEELSAEETSLRVFEELAESHPDIQRDIDVVFELDGLEELNLFSEKDLEVNRQKLSEKRSEIETVIERVRQLQRIGKQNLDTYLRQIVSLDVYVATSMRTDDEYIEMAKFVDQVFNDEQLLRLKIRYFDPTLAYCDSRIDKGIIEGLLVDAASVTVYCAQESDTFGKDSELAATLCRGKPVIVYVPDVAEDHVDKQKLDKRARTFKEFHPLGLQLGIHDGVARGVIVVRNAGQCAEILFRIFTNSLVTRLTQEQHGLVMREVVTDSVIRVMTGWEELREIFWHTYGRRKGK